MKELRRLVGSLARDTQCQFYIDISPLLEERWTGIPVVAAQLTKQFLKYLPQNTRFFFEAHEVAYGAVVDALNRSSGLYLQRDFFNGDANAGPLKLVNEAELAVGIHPSVKRVRAFFPIECSIFHDLSTLVTPQFHIAENIDYHMQTTADDLRTNAVSACVSEATLSDIHAYFGTPLDRLVRSFNGVSWPDWYQIQAENEFDPTRIEPYFMILGTREPRKNINKILELLLLFSDVLESHRFVFVGKMGWLAEHQAVPERLTKAIESGRILFTGFVSEFEKYKLLMGADATIYPSFFEGFGLPVLESLSVGTPCIASYSSSIPEVGGDLCVYHDPFSVQDLYRAVREIQINRPKQDPAFVKRCREWAAQFTWEGMLTSILGALTPVIHAKIRETNPDFAPGPLEDFDEKEPVVAPEEPVAEASDAEPVPARRGRKGGDAAVSMPIPEVWDEDETEDEILTEAVAPVSAKAGRGRKAGWARAVPPTPVEIPDRPTAKATGRKGSARGAKAAANAFNDDDPLDGILAKADTVEVLIDDGETDEVLEIETTIIATELLTAAPDDEVDEIEAAVSDSNHSARSLAKTAATKTTTATRPARGAKRLAPVPSKRSPRR